MKSFAMLVQENNALRKQVAHLQSRLDANAEAQQIVRDTLKLLKGFAQDRARLDYLEQACTATDGDHTSGVIETMDGPALSWGTLAADKDLRAAVDRRMEQAV